MGGRGPAPKPAAQRRRRNKTDEAALPAGGYAGEFPELPKTYTVQPLIGPPRKVKFLVATRRWYEVWCRSPMATEFTAVHFLRLQEIAVLRDGYERSASIDFLKEMRLQLAGFGGTPLDLRRLGRRIERSEPEDERPKAPVRRLHAVDTAAAS